PALGGVGAPVAVGDRVAHRGAVRGGGVDRRAAVRTQATHAELCTGRHAGAHLVTSSLRIVTAVTRCSRSGGAYERRRVLPADRGGQPADGGRPLAHRAAIARLPADARTH